jgi:hypothetical protein
VAAIAVSLSVNYIAAKSHQATLFEVFPFELEWDGSYRVTDVDELLLTTVSFILGLDVTRGVYHSRENKSG